MAVTAKFVADFSSFSAAVQKAEIELRSFESGANKVGPALNRMVDQFSGRKLISEATLMARVLGDAGSIARLTGNELRVAGAKAAEAAEKMRKMGVDVPPGLQRIADAAKDAASATTGAANAAKGMGASTSLLVSGMGALAGAFTLAKVVGFASDLVTAAGALQDLHERTDISIEALQRFKVIAEQSGSSLDAVASAAFQLNRRISAGADGTVSAVKALGLEFESIRSMRPEERFQVIGSALGAMTDSAKRSELGMALMGRSVDELIPTLKHLNDETGSYLTLSAQQIGAIDAIGDAFVRVKASIIPLTVSIIDNTFQISKAYNAWSAFLGKVDESPSVMGLAKAALDKLNAGVSGRAAVPNLGTRDASGDYVSGAFDRQAAQAIEDLNEMLAGKNKRLAESKAASEKAGKAAAQLATDILKIENVLPGLTGSFGRVDDSVTKTGSTLRQLGKELAELERHGWSTSGVAKALAGDLEKLGEHVDADQIKKYAQEWAFTGPLMDDLGNKSQTFGQSLDDLAGSLTQLAQVSGDSFGGMLKAIAQGVVAINSMAKALEAYGSTVTHTVMQNATMAASWLTMSFSLVKLGASFLEMSDAEKEALRVSREFRRELAQLATTEQLVAAQVVASARHRRAVASTEDISLVVLIDLYKSLGLEASKAGRDLRMAMGGDQRSIDTIHDQIDAQRELLDAIHEMGSFTQMELQAIADKSREVYEYMERAGTYSAEQLAAAWEDSAHKQAVALGDVAAIAADAASAAGFKTKAELEKIAQDAEKMYLYIRDSGKFTAGEAEKAWGKVFGSHEDLYGDASDTIEQSRAAFDAANAQLSASALEASAATAAEQGAILEEQMAKQTEEVRVQAEEAAASLEAALGGIQPSAIHVPIVWDIPPLPGGGQVEMPSRGALVPFAPPGSGGGRGGGTAIIEVEGRVLAEVSVPHLPGAIERYGLGRR